MKEIIALTLLIAFSFAGPSMAQQAKKTEPAPTPAAVCAKMEQGRKHVKEDKDAKPPRAALFLYFIH